MKVFIIITGTLLLLSSCGNIRQKNYIIDSSIKEQLDKKIISRNGITRGSVDFKFYENDSLTTDTGGKSLVNETISYINKDTIFIIGYLGMYSAYSFRIFLFKDNGCEVYLFAESDRRIFKVNPSDSLATNIIIPCTEQKLVLINKPKFIKNETLEGIIELTSEDFFKIEDGIKEKLKLQLTGYFRTDPLKSLNDVQQDRE